MSLPLLAVAFLALLALGYRTYGRFVARRFGLDDARPTPAHTRSDGVDYVATPPFYLFAQHLSAIAAAGPIVGPILACQSFGWLPCLLWIGLGVVFIGAVHDFASLVASVRHGGTSIAEIAKERLGAPAGRAGLAFIWIALVYVIVAFVDITASTFVHGSPELAADGATFDPGGAVASASLMYLALAFVMGLAQRYLRPPLWLSTVLFVPATFGAVWLGTETSTWFELGHTAWALAILGYCCIASVLPVWALLQPRGYLGGFVLYAALALGVFGVLFGGLEIEQPAFKTWDAGAGGTLFPFLFVTIACGACSGFHGLVCSGTTSKQISRESHAPLVGYGAMLAEGFVALIALVTVMTATDRDMAGLSPGAIYGNGIGRFLALVVGEGHATFARTFGAMVLATFIFDTIDVATRLGRLMLQEFFGWKGRAGALVATLATVAPAGLFLTWSPPGSYRTFWQLFGASNQLLAALTLIAIAVWLAEERKPTAFVVAPLVFLLALTLSALAQMARASFAASAGFDIPLVNACVSLVLIALALFLAGVGWARFARARRLAEGAAES